jgi:hypothetical protein
LGHKNWNEAVKISMLAIQLWGIFWFVLLGFFFSLSKVTPRLHTADVLSSA